MEDLHTGSYLQVDLLGGLRIQDAQGPRRVAGERVQSLLAYLLLHPRQPVRRERLAEILFPESTPERGRRNLSAALTRLLAAAGREWLDVQRASLTLKPGAGLRVDAWEFERLAASDDAAGLQAAVDLYAGDLLPELYDDWIIPERELLRNRYLAALEMLAGLYAQQGALQAALLAARRLVLAEPLHEPAHLAYLRLLGRLRRYGEALAHYDDLCRLLQAELGVEPMTEMQVVMQSIQSERRMAAMPAAGEEQPAFVGRAAERTAALEAVESALQGVGGILAIEGEAGIGKSRFLSELAAGARWRGGTFLHGVASELPGASPFSPLPEALRPLLQGLPGLELEALLKAESLAALAPLNPAWSAKASLPAAPPGLAGNRLSAALAALGEALPRLSPLVIALDDVHWAGPALWQGLDALAPSLARCGGLLVVVYRRPEIEKSPGWELLQAWDRSGLLKTITLEALTVDEVAQLIRQVPGADPVAVHAWTGGSPFYVMEWLAEPDLKRPPNRSAISARVRGLPSAARLSLETASVLGESIPYRLWVETSALPPLVLAGLSDQLIAQRWLHPSADGLKFEHDLIRAQLYAAIEPQRRRSLHARAARACAAFEPDNLRLRAYHLEQAGYPSEAAEAYRLAGRRDREHFAFSEAQRSLERALACLPPAAAHERAEINLELVELCDITGDTARQAAALQEALAGARRLEDAGLQYRALLAAGRAADDAGEMDVAEQRIGEALSIARALQDRRLELVALYWLMIVTAHQGRTRQAHEIAVQALALARDLKDGLYEGKLLRAIGIQISELEQADAAVDWLEQSVQVMHSLGENYDMWFSQLLLALQYSELGMWDRSLAIAGELIGHFEAAGARVKADNIRVNLVDAHVATGNPAAARRLLQEIPDGGLALGRRGVVIVQFNLGAIAELEDRFAEAERCYRQAIEMAQASQALDLIVDTQHKLGRLLVQSGRPQEALPLLEAACSFRSQEGYLLERLQSEALLGQAYLEAGDRRAAQEIAAAVWQAFQDGVPVGVEYQEWLWTLFCLMDGLDQADRANEALRLAVQELQRQAQNIGDAELRRSFFENVPLNRSIVQAYDRLTAVQRVISVSLARQDSPLGRPLEPGERVTVRWTVSAPEDEAIPGKDQRRRHRLIRLLHEAEQQGAAPTDDDLAAALGVSRRTILRDMQALAGHLPVPGTRKRKRGSLSAADGK